MTEMARLSVAVRGATLGMSTLAAAMAYVQRGVPMPVLDTADDYMEYLEDVVAKLDSSAALQFPELAGLLDPVDSDDDEDEEDEEGEEENGERGAAGEAGGRMRVRGLTMAQRLVATAEKVRDELQRSLDRGGSAGSSSSSSTAAQSQGETPEAGDKPAAAEREREQGVGQVDGTLRLSRLSQNILHMARHRFRWLSRHAVEPSSEEPAPAVERAHMQS